MEKKYLILIVVLVIIFVSLFAYGFYSYINLNNDNENNITNTTKLNNTTKGNVIIKDKKGGDEISVIQSGPSSASYGSDVMLTWTVKNEGSKTIKNVKGESQMFNYSFGTLKLGESKSIEFFAHIPSSDLLKKDFGNDTVISSSFFIGGFQLYYDVDGTSKNKCSNDISILLS